MKHVRIALEEQTDDRTPMCFDTVLGIDGKIAHQIPFAGWWGKTKSNWLRPIVFQPDGTVRFASDPEDEYEEVHSKMNVFGAVFKVGCPITLLDLEDNEEIVFVVKQVLDLDDLSAI